MTVPSHIFFALHVGYMYSFCSEWFFQLSLSFVPSQLTGFHRQAKPFELKFVIRKIFLEMVKTDGQNHSNSPVITLVLVL